MCSPFRGIGSDPARLRRFLTRAEIPSPDGSIKDSAENTMTRDSLRGSTFSIQGSLGDDNGAMVNVAPLQGVRHSRFKDLSAMTMVQW